MKLRKKQFAALAILITVISVSVCVRGYEFPKPWDGYDDTNSENYVTLVDVDNPLSIIKSGLVPSTTIHKSSKYSIKWANHRGNRSIYFRNILKDWSGYNAVEVDIFSKKATGENLAFIIDCEKAEASGVSYFKCDMTVDWEGWKRFRFMEGVNLNCFRSASLSQVVDIRFTTDGWDFVPIEGTELYFDKIRLVNYEKTLVESFFSAEEIATAQDVLKNAYCTYAGSAAVMIKNDVTEIDKDDLSVTPRIDKNGEYILPAEFLTNVLKESEAEGEVSAPELEKLGYYSYISGNTAIFSSDRDAINEVEENSFIGKYAEFYTKYCYSAYGAEEFAKVRENYKEALVGGSNLKLDDPDIAIRVSGIASAAKTRLDTIDMSKNSKGPWGEITSTSKISEVIKNTYDMARAYGTKGCDLYKDKKVLDAIVYALDFITQDYYDGDTNSPVGALYWYDAKISMAKSFSRTLLLIDGDIPEEKMTDYLKALNGYNNMNAIYSGNIINTGSNLSDMCESILLSAAISEDAETLLACRDRLLKEYEIVTENEGYYKDGSYIMHMSHAFNNGYGFSQIHAELELHRWLGNTMFRPTGEGSYEWKEILKTAYLDQFFKNEFMSLFNGRLIVETYSAEWRYSIFIKAYMISEGEEKAFWGSIVKSILEFCGVEETLNLRSSFDLPVYAALKEIAADSTIKPIESREVARVYYKGSKITQLRDNHAFGIAMFSPTIADYECINALNMEGWYQNYGRVAMCTENDPNPYDLNYWKNVNPYRIPGTTVDTQQMQSVSVARGNEYFNPYNFVGGSVLEGKYITGAMKYRAFHGEGNIPTATTIAGGGTPKHDSTLTAQKSWFAFDDELVALGSAINANDGFDVISVVENRKSKNSQLIQDRKVTPHQILSVEASKNKGSGNDPKGGFDGDFNTSWASEDLNCTAIWDLGEVKTIGYVGLAFMNGSSRQALFRLDISEDGVTWKNIFDGKSSGKTEAYEYFKAGDSAGRYVRYTGNGNTVNTWTNVREVIIYGHVDDIKDIDVKPRYLGAEKVICDGNEVSLSGSEIVMDNVKWVALEGTGGYYFPDSETVTLNKTTDITSFFEMFINHGVNPKNAGYAYVMLPNKSAEETASYAQNSPIRILANSTDIQAVSHTGLNITGIVFWNAGSINEITVSHPCIVTVRDYDRRKILAVSDPTGELDSLKISVKGKFKSDSQYVRCGDSEATIELEKELLSGDTIEIELMK